MFKPMYILYMFHIHKPYFIYLGLGHGLRIPDARPVQDRLLCPRGGSRRQRYPRKPLNQETKSEEENYFRLKYQNYYFIFNPAEV